MNPTRTLRDYAHLLPAAALLVVLPLNHTMALRLLCLFLAAAVALHSFLKAGAPPLPLKLPLALWAGMAALSLTWSPDPVFSLNEFKTEIGYGMLAFFSFYVLTQSGREWKLWLRSLMAGMLITIALALWTNRAHLADTQSYDWDWQHGLVAYSSYLALVSPFLLSLWLATPLRRFPRNLLWLGLPLLLFAGYATLNRMFWLSLGAVLIVFAVLWQRFPVNGARSRRTVLLVTGSVLALVVLLFVAVAKQRPVEADIAPQATGDTYSHIVSTFEQSERYRIWRFWLARVAERPLTGVGFGRDLPHIVHADLRPKEWPMLMSAHAHNLFLDYTLQLGIGGLAALLFLLGALLREFWRIRRAPNPDAVIVSLCGIALVVALVSKNMTDDLFWRSNSLLFWALAGMALGYGRRLESAR